MPKLLCTFDAKVIAALLQNLTSPEPSARMITASLTVSSTYSLPLQMISESTMIRPTPVITMWHTKMLSICYKEPVKNSARRPFVISLLYRKL